MRLKLDILKTIWITSDTHYGHKNICRGVTDWRTPKGEIPIDQTRDFKTIDEMNSLIVNNINKFVGPNDILIHGGDWSFGGFENILKFRNRLNVKEIYLVNGNHDIHIKKNKEDIQSYFTLIVDRIELLYDKKLVIIDHFPLRSWEEQRRGSIMLHGHTHLPHAKKMGKGRIMDIGIDGHKEFRPYNLFDECFQPMLRLPIVSEMEDDHHFDEVK